MKPETPHAHRSWVLAIVGPTASGKSDLGVAAARRLDGEIVNCDSMQMIRGLSIGTAKPEAEHLAAAPHHLYDRIDPEEYYSAGSYMKDSRRICGEIAARGRIPVLVGGTGLYLKVFEEGIFEGPGRSEEIRAELRALLETKGEAFLLERLREADPELAERISPRDHVRIVRALEVFRLSGRRMSELQKEKVPLKDFQIVKAGLRLPRQVLYDRIDRRVKMMFDQGLLEEVELLLKQGVSPSAKGFEALGYRHAVQVIQGRLSAVDAIERTRQDTRRYAKRQLTWFRRDPKVHWIEGPGSRPAALRELLRIWEKRHEL